ncbi:hypothetical protein FHY31_001090 [Xanthomonas euvesicatoria]|uniref:Uncharacterized protein n=1 Tax=Xanthomonas euvesicatoria TaxID=456327 RepID=A0AAW3U1E5_XANEU|nr:hypothetical protein [Xanthomonas euvesicatoria]MBB4869365.1 hypothetical protein [Xanthomonas euvesicatoria]
MHADVAVCNAHSLFLSCGSAISAACIVIARTAACHIACLPRSAFSTSTCLVDGWALRAPETRSGRCLFLALSIRSYCESINAVMGCEYTARFVTWIKIFESCMRALPTVRAALTAAPGTSSPPSPWRPFVLKLMCLALLHLSIFVLLRAQAGDLGTHRNALGRTPGAPNDRRAVETWSRILRTSCSDGNRVVMADSFRCNGWRLCCFRWRYQQDASRPRICTHPR